MPKHVPSFKHLIASSSRTDEPRRREKGVKDLLASARVNRPVIRDADERVWTPGVNAGSVTSSSSSGGLLGIDDNAIHPAEILRRANMMRRQASRGVAGPAPPPSWHTSGAPSPNRARITASAQRQHTQVTAADLVKSADFFPRAHPPARPERLLEYCLHTILRHLEDETPLDNEVDSGYTIGWAMREQVVFLETHLKVALLDIASMLPETHPSRLSDQSYKAILSTPSSADTIEEEVIEDELTDDGSTSSSEWDVVPATRSTIINHLPLTLHSKPIILLRQIINYPSVSLASLNLAYSTIDLEKVITLLPAGLRELGLRGVRPSMKVRDLSENWRRSLSLLGRKFILLNSLDLSRQPIELTREHMRSLLHSPATRLPSLRVLGLRDLAASPDGGAQEDDLLNAGVETGDQLSLARPSLSAETKRSLLEVIRGGGRQRYIEVKWD